jgi:hypothetical protein
VEVKREGEVMDDDGSIGCVDFDDGLFVYCLRLAAQKKECNITTTINKKISQELMLSLNACTSIYYTNQLQQLRLSLPTKALTS